MIVTLVVCMARNRVIGRSGVMPWRMPSDLRHFRAVTMGKPVIMGRKTYESVSKLLDGRTNYIVSRRADLVVAGARVVTSLEAALIGAMAEGTGEAMVIGGGEIYAAALARADRVIATELAVELVGDTLFPPLEADQWREVARVPLVTGAKDDYAADVITYERVR